MSTALSLSEFSPTETVHSSASEARILHTDRHFQTLTTRMAIFKIHRPALHRLTSSQFSLCARPRPQSVFVSASGATVEPSKSSPTYSAVSNNRKICTSAAYPTAATGSNLAGIVTQSVSIDMPHHQSSHDHADRPGSGQMACLLTCFRQHIANAYNGAAFSGYTYATYNDIQAASRDLVYLRGDESSRHL